MDLLVLYGGSGEGSNSVYGGSSSSSSGSGSDKRSDSGGFQYG